MVGGKMVLGMVMMMVAVSVGGKWAVAQVHHVVGGDRGWDASSNVPAWSSGRVFRVGDKIWFTYSAAQESIAEVKSKEEYESCDVRNPIRMLTAGLDGILLDGEGIRYFVSSQDESCKNGLKLHVEVMPKQGSEITTPNSASTNTMALAAAPTTPSASPTHFSSNYVLFFVGLGLCYMGI